MKKSKFSSTQIAGILKEFDNGKSAEIIQREHGVSKTNLYKCRQRYWYGCQVTKADKRAGRRKQSFEANVCEPGNAIRFRCFNIS